MNTWSWLHHTFRRLLGQERGQVIVLTAFAAVVVLGFGALAIDVGFFARTKRDLQNDADAMALAGAQEVPNQALATSKAQEWGVDNGVDLANELVSIQFNVTCSGHAQASVITVRLQRDQPTYLARALGITKGTLQACATAGRFGIKAFMGAAPFGLEDTCLWGPDGQRGGGDDIQLGDAVTLKYDANNSGLACDAHNGNFGALAIDLTGATPCGSEPLPDELRKYGDAICWGSITPLHIHEGGADTCDSDPGGCVRTETGNIIGPTKQSIDYVFDHASPECDTWAEVVDVSTGTLRAKCNPLSESYVGGTSIVMLIPVLHGLWGSSGTSSIPIVDFVFVALDRPPSGGGWCSGSHCDLTAHFIQNATVPNGEKGPWDPESLISTVALVE
jgi:Flp pilus assembly protein TadG